MPQERQEPPARPSFDWAKEEPTTVEKAWFHAAYDQVVRNGPQTDWASASPTDVARLAAGKLAETD